MTRRRLAVVVAIVCVLAVALAAATLPAPTDPPGEGDGSGDDAPVSGPGAHETSERSSGVARNVESAPGDGTPPFTGVCVPFLQSPAFFAAVAVAAAAAAVGVRRRVGGTPAVVVVGGGLLAAVPFWFAATDCRSASTTANRGVERLVFPPGDTGTSGGGEAAAETATTLVTDPLVAVAVVAVLAGVGVLVYVASGDDAPPAAADADDGEEDDDTSDPADAGATTAGAVAASAGAAADRIEAGGDVENEVYRAWREMAADTPLPNPEAATPGEFAAAAREAGMPADDVAALTAVFRAVRYGDADPTADRERRAVDALRGIQAAAGADTTDE